MKKFIAGILVLQQGLLPLGYSKLNGFSFSRMAQAAPREADIPDELDLEKYEERARLAARQFEEAREVASRAERLEKDARDALTATGDQLGRTRHDLQEARAQAQLARNELPSLRQRLQELTTRVQQLEQSLPSLREDARQKRTEATRIEREARALEDRVESAKQEGAAEIAALLKQARETRVLADRADQAAKQAEAQAKAAEDQLASSRTQLVSIQGEIQEIQESTPKLRERIQQLTQKAEDWEATLATNRQRLSTQKEEAKKLAQLASEAETKAEAAKQAGSPEAPALLKRAREMRMKAREAAEIVKKAEETIRALETQLAEVRRQLQETKQELEHQQAKLPQLRERVRDLTARIPDLERIAAQARRIAQEKRDEATQLDRNARALDAKAASAQRDHDAKVEVIARQAREARASAIQADGSADRAEHAVASTESQLAQARAQFTEAQRAVEQTQQRITQLTQQIIPAFEREEQDLARRIPSLEQALAARARESETAHRELEVSRVRLENANQKLAEVRQNLEQAIARARAQGNGDGAREGAQEGAQQGGIQGRHQGTEDGARDGRRDGMVVGIERARSRGSEEGRIAGWNLGTSSGFRDGEEQGTAEGVTNGRNEGLAAGFRDGLAEGDRLGFEQGSQQGHADNGYQKGHAAGQIQGDSRARTDAQERGHPQGYQEAEEEIRQAPLAEKTESGPVLLTEPVRFNAKLKLAKDSHDFLPQDHRDDESGTRNTNAPVYPHPAVREAYQQAYQAAYRESYQRAYEHEYRDFYAEAREQSYRRAHQDWASRDYPSEYREAYDHSSAASYDQAYRQEYDRAYQRVYRPSYDQAFTQAFPQKRKEGYDQGYAAGFARGRKEAFDADFAQGFVKGDRTAYESSFAAYFEAARKAGQEAARKFYAGTAVVDTQELRLTDRNGDGIFAAGEPLDVRAVLSNFGFQASPPSGNASIGIEISPLTEGLEVKGNATLLKPLAGRTRTTLLSAGSDLGLRLKSGISTGQIQRVRIRLVQGSKTLMERVLELRTSDALQAMNLTFADPVADSVWNKASFTIRNMSQRATSNGVLVNITSAESNLEVNPASQSLPAMGPGESREVQIQLRFPSTLVFRKLPLNIQLKAGTWQEGQTRFEFDTTRRWTHNPISEGLVVMTSREEGYSVERALRAAGLNFDYWNTVAEGPLGLTQSRLYRGKNLVVADARTVIDGETRDALIEGYDAGESLVDLRLGSSSSSAPRGTSLQELLANRRDELPLLASLDNLRIRESNPFKASGGIVKRWITREASTPNNETPANWGQALSAAALIAAPFEEQLSQATTGADPLVTRSALQAISHNVLQEMRAVVAVDGDQFKKNAPGLADRKVSRYVGGTLGSQGESRRRLLSIFPELDRARKEIGWILNRHRLQLKRILKPVAKAYKKD